MSKSGTAVLYEIIKTLILTRRGRQLSQAQIAKEVEEIAAGNKVFVKEGVFRKGRLVDGSSNEPGSGNISHPDDTSPDSLTELVQEESLAREERSMIHACRSALHAAADLKADEAQGRSRETEDDVNEDWIYRWRDAAGEVSSEDMQVLWGKVLAGEIRHPGAFSLRTLDFLRNLSPDEARLIERLAQFVVNDVWIGLNAAKGFLEPSGLDGSAMVRLQHIGVLVAGPPSLLKQTQALTRFPGQKDTIGLVLMCGSHCLVVSAPSDHPNPNFKINAYSTTQTGREVLKLAGPTAANVPYIRFIGRHIGQENQGFKVELSQFTEISDEQVRTVGPVEQLWPAPSTSTP